MDRFSVNLEKLACVLTPQKKSIKLEDVKHRIEKVAFDVVRFRDDEGFASLWKIEDTEEGQVIVALYDGDNSESLKSEAVWSAIADKQANIHVFKGKEPIAKVAAHHFGVTSEQVDTVCSWLPSKLASDESFRDNFIDWASKQK